MHAEALLKAVQRRSDGRAARLPHLVHRPCSTAQVQEPAGGPGQVARPQVLPERQHGWGAGEGRSRALAGLACIELRGEGWLDMSI
jgi:hypothetical protein